MLKRLLIAVLLVSAGFNSFANDSEVSSLSSSVVPHASVIKWFKGSYGNYPGAAEREKRHPMPIWVSISFDKQVNEEFVNNYFKFLIGHKPMKNKRYSHIYIVTVPANTSRSEFEDKIDKANRHFDPEIERQEQLAIEEAKAQAEREAAELSTAEAEAHRKAEEKRLRLEAEKECRAIAKANAEEVNNLPQDALYDAVMRNAVNEIIFASYAGVDLDSCRCGKAGLVWAVLFGKVESAEALLNCGANPKVTYLDRSMVAYAFESSDSEFACLLAKYGADKSGYESEINSYLNHQLIRAIDLDSLDRIHRLGFLGADVQNPCYVDLAVQRKKPQSLRVLSELGASVDKPYTELLLKAFNNGDYESAYVLIESGAGIFERNVGPKNNHDHTVLSNIIYRIDLCNMPLEQGIGLIKLLTKRGYQLDGNYFADNALFLTLNYMLDPI